MNSVNPKKKSAWLIAAGIVIVLAIIGQFLPEDEKTEPKTVTQSAPSKARIEILTTSESVAAGNIRYVHATVRNNSDQRLSAGFKSVYYDSNGVVVKTGAGAVNDIEPGQTRVVDIVAVDVQNAVKYTVEVGPIM